MSSKAQPLSVVGKALQEKENGLYRADRDDGLAIMDAEARGDCNEVLRLAARIVKRNADLEIVGRAQVRDDMDGAQDAMMDVVAREHLEKREGSGKTQG